MNNQQKYPDESIPFQSWYDFNSQAVVCHLMELMCNLTSSTTASQSLRSLTKLSVSRRLRSIQDKIISQTHLGQSEIVLRSN